MSETKTARVQSMTNPETSSDLVKRLEWRKIEFHTGVLRWFGNGIATNLYVISETGAKTYWLSAYENSVGTFGTLEAAQAAAQADYTARILSSIDATTIERLTAEMDEAWAAFGAVDQNAMTLPEHITAALDELAAQADEERKRALAAESLNARQGEVLKRMQPLGAVPIPQAGKPSVRLRDIFPDDFAAVDAALATESSNG